MYYTYTHVFDTPVIFTTKILGLCHVIYMNNQRTTSPLKIGLDVMQSHPLHRTHFGQYKPHQQCVNVFYIPILVILNFIASYVIWVLHG